MMQRGFRLSILIVWYSVICAAAFPMRCTERHAAVRTVPAVQSHEESLRPRTALECLATKVTTGLGDRAKPLRRNCEGSTKSATMPSSAVLSSVRGGATGPPEAKAILLLSITVILEIFATTCMKLAQKRPMFLIGTYAGYCACFTVFPIALRYWPLGVAYAIWSGIGTAAAALIGSQMFGEVMRPAHWASIALIIAGVVGLNIA